LGTSLFWKFFSHSLLDEPALVVGLLWPPPRGDVPERLHGQGFLEDVRWRLREAAGAGVVLERVVQEVVAKVTG